MSKKNDKKSKTEQVVSPVAAPVVEKVIEKTNYEKLSNAQPYAVETEPNDQFPKGKYIVLQCFNKKHVTDRMVEEYPDEHIKTITKVV